LLNQLFDTALLQKKRLLPNQAFAASARLSFLHGLGQMQTSDGDFEMAALGQQMK
jgi:hypothetical protein